jgi:8-oxo-dGTP diphosphatase
MGIKHPIYNVGIFCMDGKAYGRESYLNSKVVLLYKLSPEWQKGLYNCPGGAVEPGEDPHSAMAREFQEETGLYVPVWHPLANVVYPLGIVYFFYQRRVGPCPPLRQDTKEQSFWWHVWDLPPNIMPNLRWMIPLIFDTDSPGFEIQLPLQLFSQEYPRAQDYERTLVKPAKTLKV